MKRLALLLSLVGTVGAWAGPAEAAPWCGSAATQDRPPAVTGSFVHVVYAFPNDGADRSGEVLPVIAADVEQIESWWRGQDPIRLPRFDVTPFPCGLQPDLTVLRLPQSAGQLASGPRTSLMVGSLGAAGLGSTFGKYLVYYDGPVLAANVCGQAGRSADSGPSYAFVYLAACAGVPPSTTAAHELLHALGALPAGATHPCPNDDGHPCDSQQDVLYPRASGAALEQLVLDVGRDDYYGHAGSWFDLQDSLWVRKLDAQVTLTVSVTGGGRVVSLQPGPECTATCSAEWDAGTRIILQPVAGAGRRFVHWSGACRGSGQCELSLAASAAASAFFAPARFRLAVSVAGRGVVRSSPAGLTCRPRCAATFTSYRGVRLQARPAKGWRFARWTGACAGTRRTCIVPMTAAAAARATFARRP
jgi:Divergent InlB B-repeat domain